MKYVSKQTSVFFSPLLIIAFTLAPQAFSKSKYAPETLRAIDDHKYLQKNHAPDFWAMIFHYVPQGENMCQTASMAAIFNALKNKQDLDSETKNITQADIVAKVNDPEWIQAMKDHKCFSMDRFSEVLKKALNIYFPDQYQVKVIHVDSLEKGAINGYLSDFTENEKTDQDFIIANFDQAVFTGESEPAGHISPIAAYDKTSQKVLVLDVDREWYTPYWVSTETFFKGMNTQDKGVSKARGYIVVSQIKR
ncbi:MAG: hypothetical protein KA715_13550 [Xanthomonadaceae bacterium]|nr:hypothetical protein [Xanthomonadaceae bacterium]MCM0607109.1 hypothetical protein [Xanthomonadaceae bacterium]